MDGEWRIADSLSPSEIPEAFPSRGEVPGLANMAKPGFADVDAFVSREQLANRIRAKLAPAEWLTQYWTGKVEQARNYFWYQRSFRAPKRHEIALLKINKAQFGTAVWLNGQKLGEYAGCFSASLFRAEDAIRWGEQNTVLVRIGAHPAVLPDTYPTGSDFEKIKWTPGIYDSVSLIACDNPLIETVQVAPRIADGTILVQTRLQNTSPNPVTTPLLQKVSTWNGSRNVAETQPVQIEIGPNSERTLTNVIRIPDPHLWSPEDPFLYVLKTQTDGDEQSTRFGLREFQFDPQSKRAMLNGKPYYLRGSNITLHRFFEDPLCGNLPWNERWVRQLLGKLPRQMHWNYFRFCIGPVPDRWLDICDEEGILVQNEFFVWTGGPGWYQGYSRKHDAEEMIRQYKDWIRDNWNHPSVAVWDANNETKDDIFHTRIIPAVRPLDLSNRPWENSYNSPAGPNDPVEDHPYLMQSGFNGKLTFKMTNLETMDGKPRPGVLPSVNHAPLVNEYGWLWLNRDGTPTVLTSNLYPQLMGTTNVTSRERLDLYAYLLAAKTEFWRAHRNYAGIIHFVFLTCSYPGVYTADHFSDVTKLKLDPAFADYMGEAFKPVGVYLNFFQPELRRGQSRQFTILLVNDYDEPVKGDLILTLENRRGKQHTLVSELFSLPALGNEARTLRLEVPRHLSGACVVRAKAMLSGRKESTSSRRWVEVR